MQNRQADRRRDRACPQACRRRSSPGSSRPPESGCQRGQDLLNGKRHCSGKEKAAPLERFTMSKADRELSGNFVSNRGKLPMPITGPYIITSHYGQYAVEGLRNVKLDNKGIDIQGKPGAQARAIFDGKVAAVFQLNGLLMY